jgi:hypothetical protein
MLFNTGKLARQFMIETIECGTHLPEHADAFGSVLAKLGEPVIPAAREPMHLPRQRIGSGKRAVPIADIRARAPKTTAEPGEPRDHVIKHLASQMKISTHRRPLSRLRY